MADNFEDQVEAAQAVEETVEDAPAAGQETEQTAAPVEAVQESENAESAVNEQETAEDSGASQEDDDLDPGEKAVQAFSKSLRGLEGKWYVLHTYSGYEKRVKMNVESRIVSFGLEQQIFQIEVPMEEVEQHTDRKSVV